MSNFIKLNVRTNLLGFTSLALLAFASPAAAQDYSLEIKRTTDVSVEAEYASIKKQIKIYCHKMERGASPLSWRMALKHNCQQQLMTDFLAQADDPLLLAYHNDSKPSRTQFVSNKKDTKSN